MQASFRVWQGDLKSGKGPSPPTAAVLKQTAYSCPTRALKVAWHQTGELRPPHMPAVFYL